MHYKNIEAKFKKKKNIKRIKRTALPAQQKQTQQVYDGADIFTRLEDAAG